MYTYITYMSLFEHTTLLLSTPHITIWLRLSQYKANFNRNSPICGNAPPRKHIVRTSNWGVHNAIRKRRDSWTRQDRIKLKLVLHAGSERKRGWSDRFFYFAENMPDSVEWGLHRFFYEFENPTRFFPHMALSIRKKIVQ